MTDNSERDQEPDVMGGPEPDEQQADVMEGTDPEPDSGVMDDPPPGRNRSAG